MLDIEQKYMTKLKRTKYGKAEEWTTVTIHYRKFKVESKIKRDAIKGAVKEQMSQTKSLHFSSQRSLTTLEQK